MGKQGFTEPKFTCSGTERFGNMGMVAVDFVRRLVRSAPVAVAGHLRPYKRPGNSDYARHQMHIPI